MKILTKILILSILTLLIISCQLTEKLNINEDGSGTYKLNIDMSTMMAAMKQMGDSTDLKNSDPEIIDSIINFKTFLNEYKDSIAKLPIEEQEKLNTLKDMKLRIAMNEETGVFFMDFIFDFKSVDELKNLQEKISLGNSLNKNDKPTPKPPTQVVFNFDGKIFKRTIKDNNLSKDEIEAYNLSLDQGASMMEGSSYNLEYHFPKPIKKTTYKDATFSADKKTMFIKSDLKAITANPKLLEFEVILE